MSNPFPGMDPYLEGQLWPTVHNNLVEEIARQLASKLPDKYLALTNQRVVVATPDALELPSTSVRLPDVGVFSTGGAGSNPSAATISAPLVLDAAVPQAMEQTFVEIRHTDDQRLVTVIEVLSLTNKRGDGLEEYARKRQELMASSAHLLEIDLLRAGQRFPVAGRLPSAAYFVFLSRAQRRPRTEIWPIALEHSLPTVGVPLLAGDDDVPLDLQLALETIYSLFHYERVANHQGLPPLALPDEQMAWVDERLRAKGLRS